MGEQTLRVLVTGAHGFIGKNLEVHLGESSDFAVTPFVRSSDATTLPALLSNTDAVVHLAGENRPQNVRAFAEINAGFTAVLCDAIECEAAKTGRKLSLVLASSSQADRDNPYGRSKLAAERMALDLANDAGNPVTIFRLPGVFGKWCRPNYNSVVATFCHHVALGLPLSIDDPDTVLRLVYIDDVVAAIIDTLRTPPTAAAHREVRPEYMTTVGELAEQIKAIQQSRDAGRTERVGSGLTRALYATYVSMLPPERFSYEIPERRDDRGVFVEMLKTSDSGQFSFLTVPPGATRGGHYHHTKTEKFLVIRGKALFRHRHLLTNERVELRTSGARPQIVETIPGWSHDITNLGDDEMIVMLWASEIFDPGRPDTISSKV